MADEKFSDAEIEAEFREVDTNNSGTITLDELISFYKKLGSTDDEAAYEANVSKLFVIFFNV